MKLEFGLLHKNLFVKNSSKINCFDKILKYKLRMKLNSLKSNYFEKKINGETA